MKKIKIKNLLVGKNCSIKEAMRVIDRGRLGIAFVINDDNSLFGVVTDGDVRGAILQGESIDNPSKKIANTNPITLSNKATQKDIFFLKSQKEIKKIIVAGSSMKIPLVDEKGKVKDLLFVYASSNKVHRLGSFNEKSRNTAIKKVLVIGGAGYLGSRLCPELLKKGYKVRVLDNLTYGDHGIKDLYKNPDFEFIKGDIRNVEDIMKAVDGSDAVIHLAAIVGDPASQVNPKKTIEINYICAKSIAEICKFNQLNKFLFASTCSVYGASKDPNKKLTEKSFLNPVSLYAETKLKSEEGILSLADNNFSPTIFRFATIYGVSPRMRFDLVINLLTAKAVNEKKISIFGGDQWRPNVEVGDVATACIKWIESPIEKTGGEIFNVGSNSQNYKIIQIGQIIKKAVQGSEIETKDTETDQRNYNVCFNKIAKVLGFKPQKTIEKSVSEIREFIKESKSKNFDNSKYDNYKFWVENNFS